MVLFLTLFATMQKTQTATCDNQNLRSLNPISLLQRLTTTSKIVIVICIGIIGLIIYHRNKLFSWDKPKPPSFPTDEGLLRAARNASNATRDGSAKGPDINALKQKEEAEAQKEHRPAMQVALDTERAEREDICGKTISFSIEGKIFTGEVCKKHYDFTEDKIHKTIYFVLCKRDDQIAYNEILKPTEWSIINQKPREIENSTVKLSPQNEQNDTMAATQTNFIVRLLLNEILISPDDFLKKKIQFKIEGEKKHLEGEVYLYEKNPLSFSVACNGNHLPLQEANKKVSFKIDKRKYKGEVDNFEKSFKVDKSIRGSTLDLLEDIQNSPVKTTLTCSISAQLITKINWPLKDWSL